MTGSGDPARGRTGPLKKTVAFGTKTAKMSSDWFDVFPRGAEKAKAMSNNNVLTVQEFDQFMARIRTTIARAQEAEALRAAIGRVLGVMAPASAPATPAPKPAAKVAAKPGPKPAAKVTAKPGPKPGRKLAAKAAPKAAKAAPKAAPQAVKAAPKVAPQAVKAAPKAAPQAVKAAPKAAPQAVKAAPKAAPQAAKAVKPAAKVEGPKPPPAPKPVAPMVEGPKPPPAPKPILPPKAPRKALDPAVVLAQVARNEAGLTASQVADLLGEKSRPRVLTALAKLRTDGKVKLVGERRQSRWQPVKA